MATTVAMDAVATVVGGSGPVRSACSAAASCSALLLPFFRAEPVRTTLPGTSLSQRRQTSSTASLLVDATSTV